MIVTLTSVLTLLSYGLTLLLACAVVASTGLSLYLFLLAAASLRRPSEVRGPGAPATRFAILIPAHEEELVIGALLESVNALDYPRDLLEVHVIADHCSDRTGAIARTLGATVHELIDAGPRGKSRSLRWLVQRLKSEDAASGPGTSPNAFVVLDADSLVSPNFLRAMDLRMRSGAQVVQGRVQVDDPDPDRIGQLRALAYEFISHLRPLGRSALGLSAGLRGNGMCFSRECAARFPWDSDSLTEDYELHGRLLTAGLRVAFAPDAVVRTQLPQSLKVARTQSERWERGRLDAMKRHAPALVAHGIRRLSWASIDGAIELITPPFSILIALMFALLGLSLLSGSAPLIAVATVGLVAQCLYTLRGLMLASSLYAHVHRALYFVPVFVLWRVYLYLAVLTRRGRGRGVSAEGGWTRTVRTPVTPVTPVINGAHEQASQPIGLHPKNERVDAGRVCIVRHYYYPEDPRSRREAEALAAAGYHVDILTLRNAGEPPREVINGVHVRRLPVKHYRGSLVQYAYEYSAFFFLSLLVLASRFVRRPYDVVQVNSLPDFLVFAALPAKVFGARVVLDMHECTPELYCTKYRVPPSHPVVRLLGWIEQLSLALADQVITCTPQQRSVFASRGTPPGKIAVVLNAANSSIFQPRTMELALWQPGGEFALVAHGLIAERYGLDTMVRAVALLADDIPGIVLHVYGKGAYRPEMEALARRLGVADRVITHGFVPQEELLDGIARAHVGVVAARRDNFRDLTHTQKMYEYVAMRKPVVIAETSAVRTHFDDSCFQFFASDDPADMARALRELYHNPARALDMVESASTRYRVYSWEAQRHVYREAVIGVVPQQAPVRVPAQERAVRANPGDWRPVRVEAIPAMSSVEPSEMVPPEKEMGIQPTGGHYRGEMVMPETEVGF